MTVPHECLWHVPMARAYGTCSNEDHSRALTKKGLRRAETSRLMTRTRAYRSAVRFGSISLRRRVA
jgi:hypothetical protein